jgi:opacity protein-like surface antigen
MKRLLLLIAVAVVAVVALPLTAGANHGGGTSPKYEKANGTGLSGQYGEIHVNADENGSGQDLGHAFFIQGPSEVQIDVTCLNVQGNRAVFGGIVRESNNLMFPPGSAVVAGVEDNQEPGPGRDRHFRDTNGFPPPRDQNCNNQAEFARFAPPSGQTIVEGNYIVHDFSG